MSIIPNVNEIVDEAFSKPPTREELHAQASRFILENQECYVAQWILQNPFANISDYRLKFQYNDISKMGYTVEMEKIEK